MSFMNQTDLKRSLFESKSFGALSRSHPWQSSLHNLGTVGLHDESVKHAAETSLRMIVGEVTGVIDESEIEALAAGKRPNQESAKSQSISSLSDSVSASRPEKENSMTCNGTGLNPNKNIMWTAAQSEDMWPSEVANLAASLLKRGMMDHASESNALIYEFVGSIQDGMEFAADIGLCMTQASQEQRPQEQPQVQQPTTQHSSNSASQPSSVQPQSRTSQPPIQLAPVNNNHDSKGDGKGKRRGDQTAVMPFTSGRSMFVSDGGKFNSPKKKEGGSKGSAIAAGLLAKRSVPQTKGAGNGKEDDYELPEELSHLDKALVQRIESEVISNGEEVLFDDIAGLEFAKKCVQELICWPILRPDLFTGLRSLPRGVLLFGPPGTGKTLIGKAISHQAGATFFSISASSLMSKWIGEGERTVKTLFAVACYRQPSVVFLDEVDSLLSARSSEENEASRRVKTEFLVQLDGAGTDQKAQVVIVGASNRPEELDEAARRRFVKRIYIPLPDLAGRARQFSNLLNGRDSQKHSLTEQNLAELVRRTKGFSGADIRNLCTEAAMGPVRELAAQAMGDLLNVKSSDVSAINLVHFEEAMETVQATVSPNELKRYVDWNTSFGTYKQPEEVT